MHSPVTQAMVPNFPAVLNEGKDAIKPVMRAGKRNFVLYSVGRE